jgi:hypothetical protein
LSLGYSTHFSFGLDDAWNVAVELKMSFHAFWPEKNSFRNSTKKYPSSCCKRLTDKEKHFENHGVSTICFWTVVIISELMVKIRTLVRLLGRNPALLSFDKGCHIVFWQTIIFDKGSHLSFDGQYFVYQSLMGWYNFKLSFERWE